MITFPLPTLLMRALGALALRLRIVEQPRSLALLGGLIPALSSCAAARAQVCRALSTTRESKLRRNGCCMGIR